MDKLRALHYFKRTSELNSFSLAAKEFDVPASSISRRIKDLEGELGVELLQRTTRNVSTTELGSVYYEMVVEALQKIQDADELLSQKHDAMEGKIKISAMSGYGEKVLAPILLEFRKTYPSITLEIDFTNDVTILGRDTVDIAVRAGKVPDERVVAKHLSNAEFILIANPSLLAQLQQKYQRSILEVEDLSTCPTLQFKAKYGLIPWLYFKNEQWQEIEIKPVFLCNSGETMLSSALAGEGITMYPYWWVKDHLDSGELVEVPVNYPVSNRQDPNLDVFMLYQQAKYKIPKIKNCVDFILQQLG